MAKLNKVKKDKKNEHKRYDKNEIFVKVMAGLLAGLMLVAAGATLLFYLFH